MKNKISSINKFVDIDGVKLNNDKSMNYEDSILKKSDIQKQIVNHKKDDAENVVNPKSLIKDSVKSDKTINFDKLIILIVKNCY